MKPNKNVDHRTTGAFSEILVLNARQRRALQLVHLVVRLETARRELGGQRTGKDVVIDVRLADRRAQQATLDQRAQLACAASS